MNKLYFATILVSASAALATAATFTDQAAFLAQTGATSVGGFPNPTGSSLTEFVAGEAHFRRIGSSTFNFNEWTTRFPGVDMALNGNEEFSVTFDNPVHSFGFDIVEVETDPNLNGAFIDSTFSLNFYSLGSLVGTHDFNTPNDTASFVGVSLSQAFDQVQLIERVGGIENEFFGGFYTGKTAPRSVADSGSSGAMLGGVLGVLASVRALRSRQQTARA